MRFETMGDLARPAAVMIHGMFCSNSSCARFARFLQDEYYVILPTLDSHHPGSAPLRSAGQQTETLLDWLGREGIGSLALLHGTSMGAAVRAAVPITRCVFDGGPFFRFLGPSGRSWCGNSGPSPNAAGERALRRSCRIRFCAGSAGTTRSSSAPSGARCAR